MTQVTVAEYLKTRLEQLGLEYLFGVAGNYTAPFLNTILADPQSPITISGNANELCAGYAADGYARLKGIGAVHVTYSVGAFITLTPITGSYVEQVPVILINGAPTSKERCTEKYAGLLYSHTTGNPFVDINMFRSVTVAAEQIIDGTQAPYQIDSALTAMLTYQRPIYLEVAEDAWRATCPAPQGELTSGADAKVMANEADQVAAAVSATMQLLSQRPKFIFWAGIELQRLGLQENFLRLLDAVNGTGAQEEIQFVTTALSKSVIAETHAHFAGCQTLTNEKIEELVGDDGCVIGLGAWTTSKDTSSHNIRSEQTILAAHNGVFVGADYFPSIDLGVFIDALATEFQTQGLPAWTGLQLPETWLNPIMLLQSEAADQAPALPTECAHLPHLTYDTFFAALQHWLTENDAVVADAGFPLIGAQPVEIKSRNCFVAQAAWLAIGYSVAAATGVKCALPDKRVMVVVGDGSFHETCQAVSDHVAAGQNTVVFVLSNGIYGIEQYIVNPNPFRPDPVSYPDPLLNSVYAYNDLPGWDFVKLAESFGAMGKKVSTWLELWPTLFSIRLHPDRSFVVEVCIPKDDSPGAIKRESDNAVGEDEIDNPHWPPANKF